MLRSRLLGDFRWLEHGFGTRSDGAWTAPEQTARLHQVHGNAVIPVAGPGDHGDGDGLTTGEAGLWLTIRTADCVPVLLADPVRRVIAAVHAGWRGTAAEISRRAVEQMVLEWNSRAEDVLAVIGPAIGACCYAVGDDVAERFPGHISVREGRMHVDLAGVNRQQLADAGLTAAHIETLDACTACEAERFHSFRRDRSDGRMVSGIRIAKP